MLVNRKIFKHIIPKIKVKLLGFYWLKRFLPKQCYALHNKVRVVFEKFFVSHLFVHHHSVFKNYKV